MNLVFCYSSIGAYNGGMILTLSWDLFVVVLFAIVVAYSLIIGREKTLRVIIASYLAILTADGLGNLFKQYVFSSYEFDQLLKIAGASNYDQTLILIKILVCIAAIVLITIRGGFIVESKFLSGGVVGVIMSGIFGFLSAGLIISTLLVYASGASFVQGSVTLSNNALSEAYKQSSMIRLMIDNYNFWFSIPALAFLITSLFNGVEE